MDRADGEYGGVLRIDLTGDHGVQPGDNVGGQQDRIHALVRHGAVGAFAPDGDLGGKGLGHKRPRVGAHRTCGQHRQHVLAQVHIWLRHCLADAVSQHHPGTGVGLLRGLEHGDQRAAPAVEVGRVRLQRAEHAHDVEIVPAGMGDVLLAAADGINLRGGGGVGLAGALLHRQAVDVRAYRHHRAGAVFQHADGAGFSDLHVRELQRVQPRADFRGCLQLLQRQLGMLVEPHVQCFARLARGGQRSNELSKSRFHRDSVYGVAWVAGDRRGGGVRR